MVSAVCPLKGSVLLGRIAASLTLPQLPSSHSFFDSLARVDLAVSKPSAMALPAVTSERISGDRVDTGIDDLVGCGFQDLLDLSRGEFRVG